ncbi:uncharacterized protein A4U43_C06F2760 [Asparagus officinalis]|uniref:Uncharacterized protein n=1 Tax=Asparagus officinalis TaxID=4686 RepID=A0A5P1EN27_ASPOF|nr:uncharacterized protein A4U43_C06F2760 [Asparagus officinalis]
MEIYQNATPLRSQQKPSSKKLEGIREEKAKDSAWRRGMSLGPSEILRQGSRAGGARSTSPKPRKPMDSRVFDPRKGISTVGAKKPARLGQGSASGIKPKTLFEEKKRPFRSAKRQPAVGATKCRGAARIRTLRAVVESPRNSGCAKRVADLVGRKSCFAEEEGGSSLSFEDAEDSEN